MKISTIDVSKVVEEITTQVHEDYENFIFETISPHCENILQMKINKKELNKILLLGIQKENKINEVISRIEQARDKDKNAGEYPYNRCIRIVEEVMGNEKEKED